MNKFIKKITRKEICTLVLTRWLSLWQKWFWYNFLTLGGNHNSGWLIFFLFIKLLRVSKKNHLSTSWINFFFRWRLLLRKKLSSLNKLLYHFYYTVKGRYVRKFLCPWWCYHIVTTESSIIIVWSSSSLKLLLNVPWTLFHIYNKEKLLSFRGWFWDFFCYRI